MDEGSSVDKIDLSCDDGGEANVGLNLTTEIMEEENEFDDTWNSNFEDSIDRRAASALNIGSVRELLLSPKSSKDKAGVESLIGVMFSALTSDIRSAACSVTPSTSRCSSRQSLQSNTSRHTPGVQRIAKHRTHTTSTPRNLTQQGDKNNKSLRYLDKIEQLYHMDLLPDASDDSVLTEPELQAVFSSTQQHTMDLLSAAGKLQERRDAHGGYGTPSSYASEIEMNLYFDNQRDREIASSNSDSTPTKDRQQSGSSTDTGVDSELSENVCYVEDTENSMAYNRTPVAYALMSEKQQANEMDTHNMQMLNQAVSKCEQSIAHLELFASITNGGTSNHQPSYGSFFSTKTSSPRRRRSFESPGQRKNIPKTIGSAGRLQRMLETASTNMIDEDISKAVLLNLTTPDRSRVKTCENTDTGLEQFTAFQTCLKELLADESPTKRRVYQRLNRSRSLDEYSDTEIGNEQFKTDSNSLTSFNSTSNEPCFETGTENATEQNLDLFLTDKGTSNKSEGQIGLKRNKSFEDVTKDIVPDAVEFLNHNFQEENNSVESLSSESPVPTARNVLDFDEIESSNTTYQQNEDPQNLVTNFVKTEDNRATPPLVDKTPSSGEYESNKEDDPDKIDFKGPRDSNKGHCEMNDRHFAQALECNCESETESGYSTTTFSDLKSVKSVSESQVTKIWPRISNANEVSGDNAIHESKLNTINYSNSDSIPQTQCEKLSPSNDPTKSYIPANTILNSENFDPPSFEDMPSPKLTHDQLCLDENKAFERPHEEKTSNVPTEERNETTSYNTFCKSPAKNCDHSSLPCIKNREPLATACSPTDNGVETTKPSAIVEKRTKDIADVPKTIVTKEEQNKNTFTNSLCTTDKRAPDGKQVNIDFQRNDKKTNSQQAKAEVRRPHDTKTVHFKQFEPPKKAIKQQTPVDSPITEARKNINSMPCIRKGTTKLLRTATAHTHTSRFFNNVQTEALGGFNTPVNFVASEIPQAPRKNFASLGNRYKDLDKKIDRILNSTMSPPKQTIRELDSTKFRLEDQRQSREVLRHGDSIRCSDFDETTAETKAGGHATRRNIFCKVPDSARESSKGTSSVRSEEIAKSVDELVDDTAVKLGEQFLSSASPEMSSVAVDSQVKSDTFDDDAVSSVTKALQSIKLNLKREKENADKLQEDVMRSRQRFDDLNSSILTDPETDKKVPSSMERMEDKPGSSKVRTLEEVVILLKKHVQQRELEINVLGKQLNESNSRIKKMEKKMNEKSLDEYRMKGLQQDKDDLYKRLNDLLKDRDQLQTKMSKITRQKEDAEVATKKAKEDLQFEKDRRHILSKSADRFPEDDKRHSHELKERVDELELLNKSSASELDRAERELNSLKRENRSLRMSNEHELVDLKADHTVMREKLDRMHEISAENLLLHTDVADYQKELGELRDEARVLRSKCHELSEENRQCKAEIRDLRRYMDLMRANKSGDTRQDLLNKIEYYQMEHDRLLDEVRHLKHRLGDVSPRSPRMRSSSPKQGSRNTHTTPSKQSVRFCNSLERGRSPVSDAMAASTASSYAASRVRKDRSLSPSAALNVRDLTMDRYGRHMEGPESRQFQCIGGRESPHSDDSECTEFLLKPQPQVNGCSVPPPAGMDSDDDDVELHIASLRNGKGSNSSSSTQIGLRSGSTDRLGSSPNRRSRSPCSPVGFRSCSPRLTTSQKCVNDTARDRYPTQMKRSLPRRAFAPRNPSDIKLGYCIKFTRPGGKLSRGTVRYIGHLPTRNEIFVGVELDGHDGKHSGTYQGTKYFTCPTNKGVFTPFSKVIMAWE